MEIFDLLWKDYTAENPHAREVFEAFSSLGEEVVNDHIAFRTFDDPRIDAALLATPFLEAGYVLKGEYTFESKHLFARHYELPGQLDAPRVFISQLITKDFTPFLQNTVSEIVDQTPQTALNPKTLIYAGRVWQVPEFSVFEKLRQESEYAAWVYVWGFRANHFTVSVNHLKQLNTLEKVNQFLKDKGFQLNTSGGEIKGTPAELLEQSSTLAGTKAMAFKEGVFEVPACYYEFARRYPDSDGQLYSGFIAKSADKIFESTDYRTQ